MTARGWLVGVLAVHALATVRDVVSCTLALLHLGPHPLALVYAVRAVAFVASAVGLAHARRWARPLAVGLAGATAAWGGWLLLTEFVTASWIHLLLGAEAIVLLTARPFEAVRDTS